VVGQVERTVDVVMVVLDGIDSVAHEINRAGSIGVSAVPSSIGHTHKAGATAATATATATPRQLGVSAGVDSHGLIGDADMTPVMTVVTPGINFSEARSSLDRGYLNLSSVVQATIVDPDTGLRDVLARTESDLVSKLVDVYQGLFVRKTKDSSNSNALATSTDLIGNSNQRGLLRGTSTSSASAATDATAPSSYTHARALSDHPTASTASATEDEERELAAFQPIDFGQVKNLMLLCDSVWSQIATIENIVNHGGGGTDDGIDYSNATGTSCTSGLHCNEGGGSAVLSFLKKVGSSTSSGWQFVSTIADQVGKRLAQVEAKKVISAAAAVSDLVTNDPIQTVGSSLPNAAMTMLDSVGVTPTDPATDSTTSTAIFVKVQTSLAPFLEDLNVDWDDFKPTLQQLSIAELEADLAGNPNPSDFVQDLIERGGPTAKSVVVALLKPAVVPCLASGVVVTLDRGVTGARNSTVEIAGGLVTGVANESAVNVTTRGTTTTSAMGTIVNVTSWEALKPMLGALSLASLVQLRAHDDNATTVKTFLQSAASSWYTYMASSNSTQTKDHKEIGIASTTDISTIGRTTNQVASYNTSIIADAEKQCETESKFKAGGVTSPACTAMIMVETYSSFQLVDFIRGQVQGLVDVLGVLKPVAAECEALSKRFHSLAYATRDSAGLVRDLVTHFGVGVAVVSTQHREQHKPMQLEARVMKSPVVNVPAMSDIWCVCVRMPTVLGYLLDLNTAARAAHGCVCADLRLAHRECKP
jgi:hypothetical protein